MSSVLRVVDAPDAAQINMLHERACKSARDALESAKACGDLLIQAKAEVGHGGWAIWLSKNITFSSRTAIRYMCVAERWATIKSKSDTVSNLTMTGALKAVRAVRAQTRPSAKFTQGRHVEVDHRQPDRAVQVQVYACLRDAWDEADEETRRMFLLDDDVKSELLALCRKAA